jgi:cytoskeletal protein RodZ
MTNRTSRSKELAKSDLQQTPEEGRIDSPLTSAKSTEPVNLEAGTPSTEPEKVDAKQESVRIQTDVRERLARKTDSGDAFVPSNPASLEKAAKEVAAEQGFDLTRGTSVGARLIARSQKRA